MTYRKLGGRAPSQAAQIDANTAYTPTTNDQQLVMGGKYVSNAGVSVLRAPTAGRVDGQSFEVRSHQTVAGYDAGAIVLEGDFNNPITNEIQPLWRCLANTTTKPVWMGDRFYVPDLGNVLVPLMAGTSSQLHVDQIFVMDRFGPNDVTAKMPELEFGFFMMLWDTTVTGTLTLTFDTSSSGSGQHFTSGATTRTIRPADYGSLGGVIYVYTVEDGWNTRVIAERSPERLVTTADFSALSPSEISESTFYVMKDGV